MNVEAACFSEMLYVRLRGLTNYKTTCWVQNLIHVVVAPVNLNRYLKNIIQTRYNFAGGPV